MTFCRAVMCGKRLNCWKTMPTLRRSCRSTASAAQCAVRFEMQILDADPAALEGFERVDAAQQRALAAARRADNRRDLAAFDFERDAVENRGRPSFLPGRRR